MRGTFAVGNFFRLTVAEGVSIPFVAVLVGALAARLPDVWKNDPLSMKALVIVIRTRREDTSNL